MLQEPTINELIAGTPPKVEEPIALEIASINNDAKLMNKYNNYITASGSIPFNSAG